MLLAAALALSIPLHFEVSPRRSASSARYIAVAPEYSLLLSDTAITMRLPAGGSLSMRIPRARLEALDRLPARTNYYGAGAGGDWHTDVASYGRIRYRSVFPGVNLVVYGKTQHIEYDWIIAPDADPSSIRLAFTGASGIRLNQNGDLVLETPAGEVRHTKPYIYQESHGSIRRIDGGFMLAGNEIGFSLGEYDHALPLVIDPQLVFAAGFGGRGWLIDAPQVHFMFTDTPSGIAVDRSGNIYLVGTTFSVDFPLVNSAASALPCGYLSGCSGRSVFVSKLAPDGSSLLYSTYIGAVSEGSGPSGQVWNPALLPSAIALDAAGNVYVTGTTSGTNFPFTGQAATSGGKDAFIVKLNSSGALAASTLIGGHADDAGTSIAVGANGFLYLAGTTQSPDFPTTAGSFITAPSGPQNLFLAKFDSQTLKPVYSTYLGPGGSPAVGVDASGNVFVVASTASAAWPTTAGAVQPHCAGESCADIILLKINPAGNQLVYATYFGGSAAETLGGLAVDGAGNAFLGGTTSSVDLPVTSGAFLTKLTVANGGQNAFAAKFTSGGKLAYSTYVSGSGSVQAQSIAVDPAGNAYIGGSTISPDIPLANAIQETLYNYVCPTYTVSGTSPSGDTYCASAGFLTVLNPNGSGLVWSTYLGAGAIAGSSETFGYSGATGGVEALTFDPAGNLYVAGGNLDLITPPLAPGTTSSVGVMKIAPQGAGLQFGPDSITNAASFHPGLPWAGGLASLFVHGLNVSGTVIASGYQTELAGVSVLVQGVPAPILAVANLPVASPVGLEQINFQVPFEIQPFQANVVEVRYKGASTFTIPQTVAPGIFLLTDGTPAIQHAVDYSLVTPSNPAKPGEIIVVYLTGLGPVKTPVASGIPPTAADVAIGSQCSNSFVSIGRTQYAGLTPGYVGLYQMNVQLPDNLPSGEQDFYVYWTECSGPSISDNRFKSNVVTLPVQ